MNVAGTSNAVTIPGRIFAHAEREPGCVCVHFRDLGTEPATDEMLTYGTLWSRAGAVAERLAFLKPAEHVVVVMPLGPQLLISQLGVMRAGGIASIFTHPSEKIASAVYSEKLRHVVETFHPRAIVTTQAYFADVEAAVGEDTEIVLFEAATGGAGEAASRWQDVSERDIAMIQYSSGSTGLQKAVALSHDMVIAQCDAYAAAIGLGAGDRVCSWLPLYHDMGLFTSWLIPVLKGVPVSMIDPFLWVKQPESLLRLVTDTKGTLCWLPNFAFNLMAQRAGGDHALALDLSTMRGFVNCSEPVSAHSLQMFEQAFAPAGLRASALWTCYAMAENSFAVSSACAGAALADTVRLDPGKLGAGVVELAKDGRGIAIVSCGRPVPGTEVAIVHPDSGAPIEGRIGEIVLRSSYALREYYRNPELSRAAFSDGGWYRTGDLGFVHGGSVYITGRKKDLLIVGGRNFYPQDIERIADRFPGAVAGRSVALGMADEKLGTEKVILLVESRLSDAAEKARLGIAIRNAVFDELDCPVSDVRLVPHMWLLKTSSGKIARQPNLQKYERELAAEKPEVKPAASRAGFAQVAAWAFVLSLTTYAAIVLATQGTNQSWNVYMGF
jgi:acyl-CoA synthetase (AMP-forming)/AMP-acid ligase II